MKSCLQAAWVAPMDVPIIRDGAVAYEDGRILAVGKARDIISAHPDVEVEDLGDAVLLPGLSMPTPILSSATASAATHPADHSATGCSACHAALAEPPANPTGNSSSPLSTGVSKTAFVSASRASATSRSRCT